MSANKKSTFEKKVDWITEKAMEDKLQWMKESSQDSIKADFRFAVGVELLQHIQHWPEAEDVKKALVQNLLGSLTRCLAHIYWTHAQEAKRKMH